MVAVWDSPVPAVSFSDAAAALGYRSRSTLYRLRDLGQLGPYLRQGPRGPLLELEPADRPSLRQHVESLVRPIVRTTPPPRDPDGEFWSRFGRWDDAGPELPREQFWAHVAAMAGHLLGPPWESLSGADAAELSYQLRSCAAAVARGARWDRARWDAASARLLLEDLEDDSTEPAAAEALAQQLAAGRVPADLLVEVSAALARAAAAAGP